MINIEKAKLAKIILDGDKEHEDTLSLCLSFMVQLDNVKVLTTKRKKIKSNDISILNALVKTFDIKNFFDAPEKIGEECRIAIKDCDEILGFSHKNYDDWFSFEKGKVSKEQIMTEE